MPETERVDAGPRRGRVGDSYRRFPPRSPHLRIPAHPRAAVLAGLSLYDAVTRRQRALLGAGRLGARAGLAPMLPRRSEDVHPPTGWWAAWLAAAVRPVVGEVAYWPCFTGAGRIRCLLLAADGTPRAFGKLTRRGASSGLSVETHVHTLLAASRPQCFRVPQILAEGTYEDWRFLLFEAIPDAAHAPLRGGPALVAGVVDDLQAALQELERPAAVPAHHVPGHGDFTGRNVRVTRDGSVWVIDWEEAGWMPRMADELRYWVADATAGLGSAKRRADRVLRGLSRRGTADDLVEALKWPEYNRPDEQVVRDALAARLCAQVG